MSQFLHTICTTCEACSNLITLEPGPDQCDKCLKQEQNDIEEQEREEQLQKQRQEQQKEKQKQQEKKRLGEKKQRQHDTTFDDDDEDRLMEVERRRGTKRSMNSELDMESLSSLSSTTSSSGSSNSKILRKSNDDLACVSTQTGPQQTANISTTSISSEFCFFPHIYQWK